MRQEADKLQRDKDRSLYAQVFAVILAKKFAML